MAGPDKRGKPASPEALKAGHEVAEIQTRPVVAFLLIILGVSAVSFVLMVVLFRYLAADASRTSPRPGPLVRQAGERLPPEPRLQIYPDVDWRSYRAAQDSILTSYGWVDRDSAIVRVPVEQAARLVLRRGLPARPVAPPDWLRASAAVAARPSAEPTGHGAPAGGH